MANRYWVGGASATWNTTTHWSASDGGSSGASVPTASDSVFFTSNSGGTFSVTMNTTGLMLDFNCSGCAVTFTSTFGFTVSGNINIDGNVIFNNTGVTFLNGGGSFTVSFGSYPKNGVTFSSTGSWTLTSDFPNPGAVTSTVALNQGTLYMNGHIIYCGSFTSSSSNARVLDMSVANSKIITNHPTTSALIINAATLTSLTTNITGANSGIYNVSSVATQMQYGNTAGGVVGNQMNFIHQGTGALTVITNTQFNYFESSGPLASQSSAILCYPHSGTSWAYGVKVTGTAANSIIWYFYGADTYTNVNFICANGPTFGGVTISRTGVGAGIYIDGSHTIAPGGNYTLTQGYLTFKNVGDTITTGTFQSNAVGQNRSINAATGTGTGVSVGSQTFNNVIYCNSNVSGTNRVNFTSPSNFSWTGSFAFASFMGTTGNFVYAGSASNIGPPLVIYGNNNAASLTLNSYWTSIDTTGAIGQISGSNQFISGNVICGSSAQMTTFTPTFIGSSCHLTSNGRQLSGIVVGVTGGNSGTLYLNDAANLSANFTLTLGTLYLQGFNLTCVGFLNTTLAQATNVTFANGYIVLGSTGLSISVAGNFTTDQTGGIQTTATASKILNFGGTSGATLSNVLNVYVTSGTLQITFTGYFNKLDVSGITGNIFGTPAQKVNITSFKSTGTNNFSNVNHTLNFWGTGTIDIGGGQLIIPSVNVASTGAYTTGTVPSYGVRISNTGTFNILNGLNLISGTFNLNGYNITSYTGTFAPVYSYTASSNTVGLLFNGGTIQIASSYSGNTQINFPDTTNLYTDFYTGTGGFTTSMTFTRTFNVGGTAAGPYGVNMFITGGTQRPTFTGTGFGLIDFTGYTGTPIFLTINCTGLNLSSGASWTSSGAVFKGTPPPTIPGYSTACSTFTSNGGNLQSIYINTAWSGYANGVYYSTSNSAVILNGAVTTTAAGVGKVYLQSGTLNLNGYTLSCYLFDYSTTNVSRVAFNSGTIALINPNSGNYNINMPNLTNFTNDQTGGFTTTTATAPIRLFTIGTTGNTLQSQSNSNISLTFTGGSIGPLFDPGCTIGYLDFSAASYGVSAININVGSIKYPSGAIYTTGSDLTFKYLWPTMSFITGENGVGNLTIQPSNNVGAPSFSITGNLTSTGAITYIPNGTIDLRGYTLTGTNFTANAGANTGNIVCTTGSTSSAITLTNGDYVWNSQKLNMFSNVRINLSNTNTKYVNGGGNTTFGNVYNTGTGTLVLQNSDTFADLTMNASPSTLTFTTGTTPTLTNFHPSGSAGSLIAINSSTPGVQANVTVTNPVSIDYVTVQDIKALLTTWYAGTNSTDLGDNTNVIFSGGGGGSNIKGQFFLFF